MKSDEDAVMIVALEKVNEKIGDAPCPLCAQSDWQLSNRFTTMPTAKNECGEDFFLERHKIIPFAMLICQNCGNTHFIELKTLGIFDESGKLTTSRQPSEKGKEDGEKEIQTLKNTITKMSEEQAAMKESIEGLLAKKDQKTKNAAHSGAFFSFEKNDKKDKA